MEIRCSDSMNHLPVGILAMKFKWVCKIEISFSVTHIMKSVKENTFFDQFNSLTVYDILCIEWKWFLRNIKLLSIFKHIMNLTKYRLFSCFLYQKCLLKIFLYEKVSHTVTRIKFPSLWSIAEWTYHSYIVILFLFMNSLLLNSLKPVMFH